MEIFSQQSNSVIIPMPVGFNTVTVRIYKDGVEMFYGNPQSAGTNSITIQIPYALTRHDCTLEMTIDFVVEFVQETKTVVIDVVTPILPIDTVKSILKPQAPDSVLDSDAKSLERKVRLAVQAFTGQVFGLYEGFVDVYGNGDEFLKSPRRIVQLNSVDYGSVSYSPSSYLVKGDGWYLERAHGYPLTIKQAPPEEDLDVYQNYYQTGGSIVPPNASYFNKFSDKVVYRVYGNFGYFSVPMDVQQAATLLVNDYACKESMYRDRYIANMRAADWRFEYKDAAFLGTGNVIADQLLSKYQRNNLVII